MGLLLASAWDVEVEVVPLDAEEVPKKQGVSCLDEEPLDDASPHEPALRCVRERQDPRTPEA